MAQIPTAFVADPAVDRELQQLADRLATVRLAPRRQAVISWEHFVGEHTSRFRLPNDVLQMHLLPLLPARDLRSMLSVSKTLQAQAGAVASDFYDMQRAMRDVTRGRSPSDEAEVDTPAKSLLTDDQKQDLRREAFAHRALAASQRPVEGRESQGAVVRHAATERSPTAAAGASLSMPEWPENAASARLRPP